MKKKILASLLVGSAVVGASLAPLSAQAVTTGNTPVTVGIEGGSLPDGNGRPNTVRPNPDATNSNFDLLFIPREFDFGTLSISDDLTQIPNKIDAGTGGQFERFGVGDVRGTKEGWHLTGEIAAMSNGTDKLNGQIDFDIRLYYAILDNTSGFYDGFLNQNGMDIANDPTAPSITNTSIEIGGGATTLMNASVGQGQGTWFGNMRNTTLSVTTPMQQLKAGKYTGNITWNLVAGPSL